MPIPIGVLVPINPDDPAPPPEHRPMGRAALALRAEGIVALFGDHIDDDGMIGVIAEPGRWRRVHQPVAALHDRYPSQRRAERFAVLCQRGLPMGNPLALTLLCRDKLDCQRWLERCPKLNLPAVTDRDLAQHLARWGEGFLKPRFGALGTNVRRVRPGDALPPGLEGMVPGRLDPTILQRAVSPPAGWAGWSVRVLCQRLPDRRWYQCEPVVRRSREDPVVNATRGAEVAPGSDVLSPETAALVRAQVDAVARRLAEHPDGGFLVEIGVDLVIDGEGVPHVIEVNSRPRGRLEVLADQAPGRFGEAHVLACARPIRALAAWVGG